jgi:hypothetical protein
MEVFDMPYRYPAWVILAAAVVVVALAWQDDAASQSQALPAAAGSALATDTATVPRTPWGEPDLQGIWTSGYIETPLERPDQFGGREFLTDDEVRKELERLAGQQDHSTGGTARATPRPGDTGTYNSIFSGRGRDVIRTRRTSQIIDPPDGKIPWKPEAREQFAKEVFTNTATRGRVRAEDNERGGDGPEDRPNDRCLGFALPIRFGAWETGGAHHRIVQTPGAVSIYYEYGPHGGAYRRIPLDGRPPLPSHIRQWLGDARGRWEGDTLVVDTTNFTDRTNFEGSRHNLHMIERFTRTGPDLLMYRATFEDPTVFTRPWTMEIPLTKKNDKENQIYEAACHEGNYAMVGILAGARARDKAEAAKRSK